MSTRIKSSGPIVANALVASFDAAQSVDDSRVTFESHFGFLAYAISRSVRGIDCKPMTRKAISLAAISAWEASPRTGQTAKRLHSAVKNESTLGYVVTVGTILSLPIGDWAGAASALLPLVRSSQEAIGADDVAEIVSLAETVAVAVEALATARDVALEAAALKRSQEALANLAALESEDDDADDAAPADAASTDGVPTDRLALALADVLNMLQSGEPISDSAARMLAEVAGMVPVA